MNIKEPMQLQYPNFGKVYTWVKRNPLSAADRNFPPSFTAEDEELAEKLFHYQSLI